MIRKIGIDSLTLFLVMLLTLSWMLLPDQENKFSLNKNYTNHPRFDIDEHAVFQLSKSDETSVKSNSEQLKLYYSVNGGVNYHDAGSNSLDISSLRNPEIIYQNTSIRWKHPKGNFPFVKNAVFFLEDKLTGYQSNTKTVNDVSEIQSSLNVACITLPESDLFGWNTGIMTYGQSSTIDEGFYKEWWYRPGNFTQRGRDWEKEINFQYFEDGELKLDQNCGLRISGNATRYFPQKSLKIYARSEFDQDLFDYQFWGENGLKDSKTVLLRNSGNDNSNTMFADLLMHTLTEGSNVLAQKGKPVSVFINGNYWGIYNLRERLDEHYIAKYNDAKVDEVTILYCEVYGDRSQLKEGDEFEQDMFDELIAGLPKNHELSEDYYLKIKETIDIESFIDYVIFETYYANNDWLYNNTTWYKVADQKWKWVLNDLDYSLAYPGESNLTINMFDKIKSTDSYTSNLFMSLLSHPEFNEKFKLRVEEILDNQLSEQNIKAVFQNIKETYAEEIDLQIRRWRMIPSMKNWENNCSKNLDFLLKRRSIYINHVREL